MELEVDTGRELEQKLGNSMGKREKVKKLVDWVALIDELWTSDDENVPKRSDNESSTVVDSKACVRERVISTCSLLEENSIQTDLCLAYTRSKEGHSRASNYPQTPPDEGHISPSSVAESSINLRADQTHLQMPKTRQSDLLSYIDRKHSQANGSPLRDIENFTHSDSTDDGYITSDCFRMDYTLRISPPGRENETKHSRELSYQNVTLRNVRKRKASESLGPGKRSRVHRSKGDAVRKENSEQLYLDVGQKNFGHVTCKLCGMMYSVGQPSDQAEHLHFHKSFLAGVNFPGWKKEHTVDVCCDGRIIMVLPTDPKLHLKKVEEIRKLVDMELGYVSGASMASKDYKVFLYISVQRRVVGCVIAEAVTQGYQVLGDGLEKAGSTTDSWLCSTTTQPAQLGINRLWVSASARRKGIASKLVDAARSNFVTGYVVQRSKVAFSDPTPDGRAFATRYCGTPNFLVYQWC